MKSSGPRGLPEKRRRGWRARRIAHRLGVIIALLLMSTAAFTLVLLSPFLLREIDRQTRVNWSRLSEIGQTYGAASAILSTVALGAVAVSLIFQARQARAQQVQAARQYHFELSRMTLEDPELYFPSWGASILPSTQERRRRAFTNLIFNYYWMSYDLRAIPEPELRRAMAEIFSGPIGQSYWKGARDAWVTLSENRRALRFVRIIDDVYSKSIAERASQGPLENQASSSSSPSTQYHSHEGNPPIAMLLAFAGGVLAGAYLRRRQQR
jgi:hypothetical protein